MKGITKLGKQLLLVFLVLVAASTIFLSSPAVAATATDTVNTTTSSRKINGVVKWFSEQKGFGFIKRHDNGDEVFVHYSAIPGSHYKTLAENQEVEFELIDGPKGPSATNVTIK